MGAFLAGTFDVPFGTALDVGGTKILLGIAARTAGGVFVVLALTTQMQIALVSWMGLTRLKPVMQQRPR